LALYFYFPLPSSTISAMKASATISPHQVKAVELTFGRCGEVVARLEFLRGRSRWPAFWSDGDWHAWCLLATDPFGHFLPPFLCGHIVLVATLVLLNGIFNATLDWVCLRAPSNFPFPPPRRPAI
jgi:hypothetical protein